MTKAITKNVKFSPLDSDRKVSGMLRRPADASALYVLAHGAGAGMRHVFMEEVSAKLFDAGIATFRYQFPYMEEGKKRPDTPKLLTATVRAAARRAAELAPDLPVFAGGKSMGGRMTSQAASAEALPGVKGLAFLGFPLHAPGRNSTNRADHLGDVALPMLFLQGTRDSLAEIDLIGAVTSGLGRRATLHVIDGGDHSFKVLKRSGRTDEDVMTEIRDTIVAWVDRLRS